MNRITLLVVLVSLFIAGLAFSQIPRELYYESYYETDGNIDLVIRIYTNASAGGYLYEDSNTVTVTNGAFSTRIGDNTAFGSLSNALASGRAYLDITINGTNRPPREQILPEAYALKADTVPDNAITASMIATGAIQGRHIVYGAVAADQLAANAVTSDKIADNAISINDLNMPQLDARYVTSQQAVTTTPANLVYLNDFSANPFAENWTGNAHAWWTNGCIKLAVCFSGGQNGVATYSSSSVYRRSGYELFVTTTNAITYGLAVKVYLNSDLVGGMTCGTAPGVYRLAWTSSWNRVEFSGPGYYSGQYSFVTEFRVNELKSFQAGDIFARELHADRLQMDSIGVGQLLGVTNITSPSPSGQPSKTIRLASGTPPISQNSGDVQIETGSGQYSTVPGSITLKPGNNTYHSGAVGGSVNLYMGSGGDTSRTKDGAICFFGLVSNGVPKQVAALDSTGNWSMTGAVRATSFTGNGSGLTTLNISADTNYVRKAGGTMTGTLTLQTNLAVNGYATMLRVVPQGDISMGTFTNGP